MSTMQRTISSSVRRINPLKSLCTSSTRRPYTQKLVRANDIVLLKPESNQKAMPTLSKPVKPGDSLVFRDHRKVKADDVIGKPYRSVVAGGRRALFRIYEPTLGEYVDNAPRLVTPIYSSDASLIVSLLDINYSAVPSLQSKTVEEAQKFSAARPLDESIVSEDGENGETKENESLETKEDETLEATDVESLEPAVSSEIENLEPTQQIVENDLLEPIESKDPVDLTDAERFENWDVEKDGDETLEIFEAGTGAGSLTLHLARAIHGANTRAPTIPKLPKTKGKISPDEDIHRYGGPLGEKNEKMTEIYNEWRSQRRAIIHSLDADDRHSRHAQKTVRNYRHGIYFPHIDFHVGSIHDYLSKRLEETNDVFLDHAILDIPSIEDELEIVAKCIKPDGRLITWCPSVTQHMKCLDAVKGKKLPLVLDRVLELGSQLSTGGREWEVRSVKPRALIKAEKMAMAEKMSQDDKDAAASLVDDFLARLSKEEKVESSANSKKKSKSKSKSKSNEEDEKISETEGVTGDTDTSGWEMICRPRVGDRISGGGFVGVWKKMDFEV